MTANDCIQIYDYEKAIESAVQAILIDGGVSAYTSFSEPEMEKDRPRVEIEFQTGTATGHRATSDSVYRPDSFTGICSITVVTNTSDNAGGAQAHSEYRSLVRFVCAQIETTLTDDAAGGGTLLPYHSVNRFIENGTSPTIHHDSGVLASQINFDVHFNIRPDAWPV